MENSTEKTASAAMRAGFTLLEILVAVSILGILMTMAVMNVTARLEESNKTTAANGVQNVKSAVGTYFIENKKYPSALTDLVRESGDKAAILDGGEGALDDPWGNQFKMEGKGSKIVIISAGPDGQFGTEDDIRSDKIKKGSK